MHFCVRFSFIEHVFADVVYTLENRYSLKTIIWGVYATYIDDSHYVKITKSIHNTYVFSHYRSHKMDFKYSDT